MTQSFFDEARDDLAHLLKRLPNYAKLVIAMTKDPEIPKKQKVTLLAGIGYLASPIDLVPGVIPVLGQLDDMLAVLMAIEYAMRYLPEEKINAHLNSSGVDRMMISADIATIKKIMTESAKFALKKGKDGALRMSDYVSGRIRSAKRRLRKTREYYDIDLD